MRELSRPSRYSDMMNEGGAGRRTDRPAGPAL
jgi:hypothetical protein